MLKICLTYDYELFMGGNMSSAKDILFDPAEKIKNAMDELGVKGVFFVDVCSAIAHREAGIPEYSDAFDEQLQNLVADRHDVQLHIHSSWFKAKEKEGVLCPGEDGHRIHEFGFDENKEFSVQKIIRDSIQYLNLVCKRARADYECMAYRAGGFCIQPEQELVEVLLKNGILIDSSVVPHYFSHDDVNGSDFRRVPKKINWWISPKTGISVASTHGIYEVPVASSMPRLIECLLTSRKERSLPGVKLKGEYVGRKKEIQRNIIQRRIQGLTRHRIVSLDTRHYKAVVRDLEFIYKKYRLDKNDAYICLICHPKLADDIRVENIKNLILEILHRKDKFEFTTMEQIAINLKGNSKE